MKRMTFIFTGIFMLSINPSIQGALKAKIINNTISIESDKNGIEGFKGCDITRIEKVPAFKFNLLRKGGKNNQTCGARNAGKWDNYSTYESSDGKAIFSDLPNGVYKIVSFAGQPIGCEIIGDIGKYPSHSIVYEKEVSEIIIIDENNLQNISSSNNENNGTLESFKVYPNPTQDILNIELNNIQMAQEFTISLIDLLGQELITQSHSLERNKSFFKSEIQVNEIPPGAYFVRVVDINGKSLQNKILIIRER